MYNKIRKQDPAVYKAIHAEVKRQQEGLELIASENFTSEAVMEAQGCVMTNKYAEGYPGKRYYGGCENVDVVETMAIERAKKLFGAEHANVQAHSGTQANIAVLMTFLQPGDTIMGLQLAHGGHLSHGHPLNFSGKYFNVVGFGVSEKTELIDYEQAENLAKAHQPKLLCIGASAYAREFDWARFRKIADSVGAIFMADIAHYAGLVVAGLYPSPVPYADVVTTTTHKTLRGPRGGLILSKQKYAADIDRSIFPGDQGGPLMHVIAAKAVALGEALKPAFKTYQRQVKENAKTLAEALTKKGLRIVTGGTDSHMFLVDLRLKNITGKEAEAVLGLAGITTNKNAIPFDPQKPFIASGIRLGSPAVTTRGMKRKEMLQIANWISEALDARNDGKKLEKIRSDVRKLCSKFPLYKDHSK
ncbi:MAG: Serine hydroxymethyltransferase [Elusimicrobia bacterium]|nr:Serine hydroxymethyltransferase [Elusimicrobiota bacterium]